MENPETTGRDSSSTPGETSASTQNITEVRPSVLSNPIPFTSGLYQKLTNPLSLLVKELPVVDSNDMSFYLKPPL
jgi:hypothetical protein